MGSKFRCMRSTPTEMQSMSENDFECLASTGVNTAETKRQYFPGLGSVLLLKFLGAQCQRIRITTDLKNSANVRHHVE
jgi:hypothetical protein